MSTEFKNQAQVLDQKYGTHKELFVTPTYTSMGVKNLPIGKTPDSPIDYLCGNSLGLMPKNLPKAVQAELQAWGERGVDSHFRHPMKNKGLTDWVDIDLPVVPLLARVVGAKTNEVACMGTLTMDLNALLCSFYKPTPSRFKILFEKHAFPSDYYALLNQVKLHGFDEDALIQLAPRKGEFFLRTEDILSTIEKEGDQIAVVCFSGIQYYSGQYFDIKRITEAGHKHKCLVGWDLAHVAGNVDVQLHDWDVDFAAWCSYKYLNAGPGGIGGIFVNEKFQGPNWRPRLAGWWGNDSDERFKMLEHFKPIEGALGFRQSNPSVIDVVSLHAALETYEKCGGIKSLRAKSKALTLYLENLLHASSYYRENDDMDDPKAHFTIITPSDPEQRGAQLSLLFGPHSDDPTKDVMTVIFKYLGDRGVIGDERKPNVIRLAPIPAYNTFADCYECVTILNDAFKSLA